MTRFKRPKAPRWAWIAAASFSIALGCFALAQDPPADPSGDGRVTAIGAEDDAACLSCHEQDVSFSIKGVSKAAIAASPHKEMNCQSCHSAIDGAPHTVAMKETKAACADCHSEEHEVFSASAHAKPDKVEGDHPTCFTCHGGGDPHAIKAVAEGGRKQYAEMCSSCHRQTDRMERYGVDPDAVPSYEESFHGKALLRFDDLRAATCTDCHGSHTMTDPGDPKSNVSRGNVSQTCSKPDCHPGAGANFAVSGANHLRLKMKDNDLLYGIYLFFRILTFAMIAFMLGGVGLDIRSKVFGPRPPKSGRFVGFTISLGYMLVLVALMLGMFSQSWLASAVGIVAGVLLVLAYVVYLVRNRGKKAPETGRKFQRFNVVHRIQHVCLMISFTLLMVTGMPQRFFNVEWLEWFYVPFGGLEGARYFHRAAAVLMIFVFVWHTLDLLVRWAKVGFSLKALTMLPNRKDVHDFGAVSKHYLGLGHEEPKFDRFQFKQKMDYLAEYWGVPLMVVTGFIQWFPVYWGNRLPEIGLPAAAVAHSWEATLAFLAIITWHIYNEHFNPDAFPMSKVWITGELTHEEMLREHPLELERILAAEGQPSSAAEIEPEPEPEAPATEPETEADPPAEPGEPKPEA